MRAVAILALAALLCSAATATVTAPATQEEAKNLKDNWPTCSQIVKGRLGSLTPAGTPQDSPYSIMGTVTSNTSTGIIQYWPCQASSVKQGGNVLPVGTGNLFVSLSNPAVSAVYEMQTMIFSMPAQKNDVAKFIATLALSSKTDNVPQTAIVTTSCADTGSGSYTSRDNNMATTNGTYYVSSDNVLNVYLNDINACPRFPYTNSAMPSGAVAALIIVLACFVIQFGICGWYHVTHKQDTPFTEHQVE